MDLAQPWFASEAARGEAHSVGTHQLLHDAQLEFSSKSLLQWFHDAKQTNPHNNKPRLLAIRRHKTAQHVGWDSIDWMEWDEIDGIGWMDGWMDGWKMDGWMDGWRMDGWMVGSMHGWMGKSMDQSINQSINDNITMRMRGWGQGCGCKGKDRDEDEIAVRYAVDSAPWPTQTGAKWFFSQPRYSARHAAPITIQTFIVTRCADHAWDAVRCCEEICLYWHTPAAA